MTDVFLISPPYGRSYGTARRLRHGLPPLGLASINAFIKSKGYRTRFIDLAFSDHSDEDVVAEIVRQRPRLVGITAVTTQIMAAVSLAQQIKHAAPETTTILGGPHPSALPEPTAACPGVDVVVNGEGEIAMIDLLEGGRFEDTPGLAWAEDGVVRSTGSRPTIPDLNALPAPDYDGLEIHRYRHEMVLSDSALPVMSGRGCPFRCNFCASDVVMPSRKTRFLDVSLFVDHIEDLQRRHGIRNFVFSDETFVMKSARVMEICDEILRRGLNITWVCQTRVNGIEEELVRTMKRAGCSLMAVGIESGDQRILDTVGKGIKKDRVVEACHTISRAGISLEGFFILGLPYETPGTIRRTIDFAKSLPLDFAQFSMFIPLPGTPAFDIALDGRAIRFYARTWDDCSRYTYPVVESDAVSRETLKRHHAAALREFYFRPRMMSRWLRKIHSWQGLRNFATNIVDFFQILTAKKAPHDPTGVPLVTRAELARLMGSLGDAAAADRIAGRPVRIPAPAPATCDGGGHTPAVPDSLIPLTVLGNV